jgi:hypothetical protein
VDQGPYPAFHVTALLRSFCGSKLITHPIDERSRMKAVGLRSGLPTSPGEGKPSGHVSSRRSRLMRICVSTGREARTRSGPHEGVGVVWRTVLAIGNGAAFSHVHLDKSGMWMTCLESGFIASWFRRPRRARDTSKGTAETDGRAALVVNGGDVITV